MEVFYFNDLGLHAFYQAADQNCTFLSALDDC